MMTRRPSVRVRAVLATACWPCPPCSRPAPTRSRTVPDRRRTPTISRSTCRPSPSAACRSNQSVRAAVPPEEALTLSIRRGELGGRPRRLRAVLGRPRVRGRCGRGGRRARDGRVHHDPLARRSDARGRQLARHDGLAVGAARRDRDRHRAGHPPGDPLALPRHPARGVAHPRVVVVRLLVRAARHDADLRARGAGAHPTAARGTCRSSCSR